MFMLNNIHGLVPDSSGHGIIISLLKAVNGNKTLRNNYHCITLKYVISKLFESELMLSIYPLTVYSLVLKKILAVGMPFLL